MQFRATMFERVGEEEGKEEDVNDSDRIESEDDDDEEEEEKVWKRVLVLSVFVLVSSNQGFQWLTFSSIDPDKVEIFFSKQVVNDATISLLLNWGPILGVLMFPVQAWLSMKPNGFHLSLVASTLLCMSASCVRILTVCFGQSLQHSHYALGIAHLAQILNAAAGPFCMGCSSRLSRLWFPEHQRTLSTGLAVASSTLGTNFGFLVGPHLVQEAEELAKLFWLEFAISFLCFLLLFTLPKSSKDIPCKSQTGLLDGLKKLNNLNFALCVVSAGLVNGTNTGWSSMFQTTLKGTLSEKAIGKAGFLNGLATILASTWVGLFSHRDRLKVEILAGLTFLVLTLVLFMLFVNYLPVKVHEVSTGAYLTILAAGIFVGGTQPQLFELSAKLIHPVNEATSVGLLVFLWNFAALVIIAICPLVSPQSISFGFFAVVFLSVIALVKVRSDCWNDETGRVVNEEPLLVEHPSSSI